MRQKLFRFLWLAQREILLLLCVLQESFMRILTYKLHTKSSHVPSKIVVLTQSCTVSAQRWQESPLFCLREPIQTIREFTDLNPNILRKKTTQRDDCGKLSLKLAASELSRKATLERRNSTNTSNGGSLSKMAFKATRIHKQHGCFHCFTRCYSVCCHRSSGFLVFCSALTVARLLLSWQPSDRNTPETFHCSDWVCRFSSDAKITFKSKITPALWQWIHKSSLSTKTHTCMFIWEDRSRSVHLGFGSSSE